jgi:hypothetical protein
LETEEKKLQKRQLFTKTSFEILPYDKKYKQAGAELSQAQEKLGLAKPGLPS